MPVRTCTLTGNAQVLNERHIDFRHAPVCGLRSAVCGLRSAVCGLRSAVCGSS
ncbi:hypothetical protein ACO0M4_15850 [Streptomyces sp. RGM 3693]|uniref:hypothetical protein n=1 Tax=Streptomyces sp. RGM 3693 TaxID=3413284 RepID=UPI003D2A9555